MAAVSPDGQPIDLVQNRRRMQAGELYYAFTPDLMAARKRAQLACEAFNSARDVPRRKLVELVKDVLKDERPLPPPAATEEDDAKLFEGEPWIERPLTVDYGFNVKYRLLKFPCVVHLNAITRWLGTYYKLLRLGVGVFVNFSSVWLDTCPITVGARTLIGPNCSFYSATHPLDPRVRNGTSGPEAGQPITIGEDCWFGGHVIVLPGVTIGNGVVVGAGSVVTKSVPDMVVVAGNPARVVKKIESSVGERKKEVLAGESAPKVS